jgi:hypothetical protein
MTKNPWMKFYPADWRANSELRMCGAAARGVWMEMLCIMHEAEPRGSLLIQGRQVTAKQLSSLSGLPLDEVEKALAELAENHVFGMKKNGVLFSRRMEKEEEKARKNRENGKMGGNPSLYKETEKQQSVNPQVKAQKLEARSQKLDTREEEVEAQTLSLDLESPDEKPAAPPKPSKTKTPKAVLEAVPFPDYFVLSDEVYQVALDHGWHPSEIPIQIKRMRGWSQEKPGTKGFKRNWQQFAFNWLTSDRKPNAAAASTQPRRSGAKGFFETVLGDSDDFG